MVSLTLLASPLLGPAPLRLGAGCAAHKHPRTATPPLAPSPEFPIIPFIFSRFLPVIIFRSSADPEPLQARFVGDASPKRDPVLFVSALQARG